MRTDPRARDFRGAKAALVLGHRIAVLRRDDIPGIDFPGMLDVPGGGREPGESPEACVLREIAEETGLRLAPERLVWGRLYENPHHPLPGWFFAAPIAAAEAAAMKLGDEGQSIGMMDTQEFLDAPDAIAHLKPRLEDALAALGLTGGGDSRGPDSGRP